MNKKLLTPDYIFESSWEVCNKVGGIYTVLSTRAKTLQEKFEDKIIFIGPDFWKEKESPYFREEPSLFAEWQWEAKEQGLKVRVGRWTVPGEPIAVLVDFTPYFEKKNEIYTWLWENYRVDSLHAYGDYDEASMFSYAAGLVVESFYHHSLSSKQKVVYHANEWMCGLGALYIKNKLPQIATVFTTHATSIGRSIAGNQKPLYDYLFAYNGDQMAEELNMQSKHSIEKQTAWHVDCFTTVSDITANECKELLDKPVDVVLPNGFDNSFVPKAASFTKKRKAARQKMLQVANALLGENLDDETIIVSTSGRYEFRNKGIDVFVEAMNRLLRDRDLKKKVLAFIVVPGWVGEPRKDLQERLESGKSYDTPLEVPQVTHWLHNMGHDSVLNMMKYYDMHNRHEDNVKVVFLPDYLDGRDGIMNLTYYDVVLGNDLCIYPSYYEPWGYTPLEAVAFKVPCITTDLAGFGLWANKEFGHEGQLQDGVRVIHRTDYNYSEVADYIKDTVAEFSTMSKTEVDACRKAAETLSKKALWKEFIKYYYEAYDIALKKVVARS
ncbi:Glycogen synthase [Prevotella communis]|jgi:glycosyltransferase involved in cell wall biosynthesis|uniref:Glycogen synthase n=1 Tax=Prevotella communis TaxID=2913614 RepID=A0A1H0DY97_9BACT|nr:glycogen/starch synthase [Prevotella communis]UKK60307.1 glycogen/starch synthase [Prevotella communis]UKK63042.1 glycogen/starch synthase [Prevotella communis]UKK65867.1 glycogen/starch synthase [Prevotella communis]UKK68297.1 glycogen/starch synthase [Prevotella communis]UKK69568.1 glycogen/starch synthase [Prevotella communis]